MEFEFQVMRISNFCVGALQARW